MAMLMRDGEFENKSTEAVVRTSPERFNVVEAVVANGVCVGCGMCAGVCPQECLEMRETPWGEHQPAMVGECSSCGLCISVCPFSDVGPNEDDIAKALFAGEPRILHTPEIGYYRECYVGHVASEERRWARTSGGLATWFLAELLRTGRVDHVACVNHHPDPAKLFEFAVADTEAEVWQAATSCYYPVEMSQVLRRIDRSGGRYAIVALPCYLKGLRKALRAKPKLAARIPIMIGLVCGQLRSKFLAEYLIRLAGGTPERVQRVNFRAKRLDLPANENLFGYTESDAAGTRQGALLSSQGYADAWVQGYFKINACNYCDDLFAEVGDAAFMDAWLPEYSCRPGGTNLVVARSCLAQDMLAAGRDRGDILLAPIAMSDLVRSQRGILRIKREGLAHRLFYAQGQGLFVPRKRVAAAVVRWAGRFQIAAELRRVAASRIAFQRQKQAGPGLRVFYKQMKRLGRRDRLAIKAILWLSKVKHLLKSGR